MLTVLILSLSNLFIAIFMTESKKLKLTLHLVIGAMQTQAHHLDQLKALFFLTFIYDLFFDILEIDIANYADDTIHYALDSKLENTVKLLEENADRFFDCFQTTILKQTVKNATCL